MSDLFARLLVGVAEIRGITKGCHLEHFDPLWAGQKKMNMQPIEKCMPRHGAARPSTAAHKLARIIFHLVTAGEAYGKSSFAAEEQRQRKRIEKKLKRTANQLGYQLIPLGQTVSHTASGRILPVH